MYTPFFWFAPHRSFLCHILTLLNSHAIEIHVHSLYLTHINPSSLLLPHQPSSSLCISPIHYHTHLHCVSHPSTTTLIFTVYLTHPLPHQPSSSLCISPIHYHINLHLHCVSHPSTTTLIFTVYLTHPLPHQGVSPRVRVAVC